MDRFSITQFTTTFLPTYLTGTRENTPKREKTHPKTRKRTPKREKHSNKKLVWLKVDQKIYLPTCFYLGYVSVIEKNIATCDRRKV